jgi:hypothetical protein
VRILDEGGEVVREGEVRRPGGRVTLVWKVPPRQEYR